MRLEEYWGVGPKTAATLRGELGEDRAVEAIEAAEVRTLARAGIPRGRATRILRRATGAGGMDVLATGDTRDVYDDLLARAAEHALTEHAADRIRVMTPLPTREDARQRLDEVLAARRTWEGLSPDEQATVEAAFDAYDDAGGTRKAAVEAALALRSAGVAGETFERLAGVDEESLREAADALGGIEGPVDAPPEEVDVAAGVDEELDRLRERLQAASGLQADSLDVLEAVRGEGVRSTEDFQAATVEYLARETDLRRGEIEAAAPTDAADAADFVSTTLRTLVDELEADVAETEEAVATDLLFAVEDAMADVEAAVAAVDDVAQDLSLARFAAANDLGDLRLVEDGLAFRNARNLGLSGDVQPVSYAVGDHDVDGGAPSGDRVAVLTGANSGGKTTLLETCCQITLLARMGLPVPAEDAEVGWFETVVFHRRHASFNAGVLESTLRSIVPPLTDGGRTLMLVDEFEAITEPGRAADLLNGLVDLTVERDALGAFVTHLADDLAPLPANARTDGIFAQGLTEDLELRVDYQPRFERLGKSTPEFIVSRLVANAGGRDERQVYEELAAAVGEEAVQRTLDDAAWTG